jgi:hypothetical protein
MAFMAGLHDIQSPHFFSILGPHVLEMGRVTRGTGESFVYRNIPVYRLLEILQYILVANPAYLFWIPLK